MVKKGYGRNTITWKQTYSIISYLLFEEKFEGNNAHIKQQTSDFLSNERSNLKKPCIYVGKVIAFLREQGILTKAKTPLKLTEKGKTISLKGKDYFGIFELADNYTEYLKEKSIKSGKVVSCVRKMFLETKNKNISTKRRDLCEFCHFEYKIAKKSNIHLDLVLFMQQAIIAGQFGKYGSLESCVEDISSWDNKRINSFKKMVKDVSDNLINNSLNNVPTIKQIILQNTPIKQSKTITTAKTEKYVQQELFQDTEEKIIEVKNEKIVFSEINMVFEDKKYKSTGPVEFVPVA